MKAVFIIIAAITAGFVAYFLVHPKPKPCADFLGSNLSSCHIAKD